MNVIWLVIDSLRAQSLASFGGRKVPRTPFFDRLDRTSISFRRAYAAECWTLPSHVSMFTGLLPSEHGAHFQSMAYTGSAPTIAEILSQAGHYTEIVTRNFMFDGTIPGVTRGFQVNTRPVREIGRLDPFALILALNKPRSRRLMKSTAFFHPLHRTNRKFLSEYSKALLPADEVALDHVLETVQRCRKQARPYFIFSNLYDVHWPYPPSPDSVLREWTSLEGIVQNLAFPFALTAIGSHAYLRPGFKISARNRQILLDRYHRAIELMDAKLERFYSEVNRAGFLDDTMLIITSDHGEGFGEHGLYLHDGSLYNTHLHVPLWVHHPEEESRAIEDVVSTRELFSLVQEVTLRRTTRFTVLNEDYRQRRATAHAEHFFYPHLEDMQPRYRQNIRAAITQRHKVITRREGAEIFDLGKDPEEAFPGKIDDPEVSRHIPAGA